MATLVTTLSKVFQVYDRFGKGLRSATFRICPTLGCRGRYNMNFGAIFFGDDVRYFIGMRELG